MFFSDAAAGTRISRTAAAAVVVLSNRTVFLLNETLYRGNIFMNKQRLNIRQINRLTPVQSSAESAIFTIARISEKTGFTHKV